MIGGRGVFNIQCTMSRSDQNTMEWPWHWLLVLLQAVHHSQHRDYPSDPTCLLVRSSIWWQELTQVTKALQGSWSWVTKTKVVWERHNTLSFVFHQHKLQPSSGICSISTHGVPIIWPSIPASPLKTHGALICRAQPMSSSMVFLHCGCIIAFLATIGVNFSYLKPLPVVGGWCHLNILGALSFSFWVTLCHRAHLSKVPAPVPDGRLDRNWDWDSWSRKYRKE